MAITALFILLLPRGLNLRIEKARKDVNGYRQYHVSMECGFSKLQRFHLGYVIIRHSDAGEVKKRTPGDLYEPGRAE
jgi:hypothetical protein